MKNTLNIASATLGILAAVMWWIASTRVKRNMEAFQHEPLNGPTQYPYLDRIARWNRWAAVFTGASVACSSAAAIIPDK